LASKCGRMGVHSKKDRTAFTTGCKTVGTLSDALEEGMTSG